MRKYFIVGTWIVLVGIAVGTMLSSANGANLEHGKPGRSGSYLLDEIVKSRADLGDWPSCSARPMSDATMKLCQDASGNVDTGTFRATRDRLHAGVRDTEALCQIDAALVRSQYDCSLSQHTGDVNLIAGLMSDLAYSWWQQGNVERADQLFGRALAMLTEGNGSILGKMGLLQNWGHLKLAIGETERAKELAEIRTAIARRDYQTSETKDFSARVLISALEFQVWMFERVGLAFEARAARQEVQALSVQLEPCTGLCGEVIRRVE